MACFATPYGLRCAGHCSTRAHAQQSRRALIAAGGNQGVTSRGFSQEKGDFGIVEALRAELRALGEPQEGLNAYIHKARMIAQIVPSAALSIDNFVEAHSGDRHLELCAKLAIAKSILNAERQSKLRMTDPPSAFEISGLSGTWYMKLWHLLSEGLPKSECHNIFDNVTIITFNYDRCIEHFLAHMVSSYYGLEPYEGFDIVNKLRILHPYGKVGGLLWQNDSVTSNFGEEARDLLSIAKQIKTFSEGIDDEDLMFGINSAVERARKIVFLGFAFHPMNMKLLKTVKDSDPKRYWATCYGMSPADLDVVRNNIVDMVTFDPARRDINDASSIFLKVLPCADYLNQFYMGLRD